MEHSNPRLAVKLPLNLAVPLVVPTISELLKLAVLLYRINQILKNQLFNIRNCLCQQGPNPINKMMLRKVLRRMVNNLLIRFQLKAVLRKRRSLRSLNISYFVQQSVGTQLLERQLRC